LNEKTKKYWDAFWGGKKQPQSVKAEQFGFDSDTLARLVVEGKKTATSSGHIFYELENEALPVIGSYSIILNSEEEPVAITKVVDVQVIPMNEVPEEHMIAEGEGDLSCEYWWNGHKEAFTKELAEYNMVFSEDMLVVCEKFELVDAKTDV